MSQQDAPQGLESFFQGTGGEQQQQQQQTDEGQGSDSLSSGFLANVPDADRAVVERYVNDWDANVTRKFQEIHSQYAPYKELGDPQQLQEAMQVYQLLDQNPEVIYEALQQHFASQQQPGQQQQMFPPPGQQQQFQQQTQQTPQQGFVPGQQNQQQPGVVPPELANYLSPLQQQLQQQQQMLQSVAQVIVTQNQQQQQQQEDAMLDTYLADLKQKHGDFDEQYVLVQIYNGIDGDQAVQQWKDTLNQYANQNAGNGLPNPPAALSGGSAPSESVDLGKIDRKDVVSLTSAVMQAAAQER